MDKASKWNTILKKDMKLYIDKQNHEIASGGCANGNCKDYAGKAANFKSIE
jgi:hypothetical protein